MLSSMVFTLDSFSQDGKEDVVLGVILLKNWKYTHVMRQEIHFTSPNESVTKIRIRYRKQEYDFQKTMKRKGFVDTQNQLCIIRIWKI